MCKNRYLKERGGNDSGVLRLLVGDEPPVRQAHAHHHGEGPASRANDSRWHRADVDRVLGLRECNYI